eukprot:56721-Rhodomonas_salina.1
MTQVILLLTAFTQAFTILLQKLEAGGHASYSVSDCFHKGFHGLAAEARSWWCCKFFFDCDEQ